MLLVLCATHRPGVAMEPEPDGLAQVRDAHNYAWTVLEGILPYSAQVHKRHGQRTPSRQLSNYDALDEMMRQSERALKEIEQELRPTQAEANVKAATRRRVPGKPSPRPDALLSGAAGPLCSNMPVAVVVCG